MTGLLFCHDKFIPQFWRKQITATKLPAEQDLANQFVAVIRKWLSPSECREIDRRNETADPGICHSHDFCDANQAMIDALGRLNVEFDARSDEIVGLINRAWDIAKAQGFGSADEC